MGRGVEVNAIDPDDNVSRSDSRHIRARSRHDLPYDSRTRHVCLKNDAIVRTRKEHIRDRKGGDEEREDPGRHR